MSSINTRVLFDEFPQGAHESYARSVEYSRQIQSHLPPEPTSKPSILSTPSTVSYSNLQNIPFFDLSRISWPNFEAPPDMFTNPSYFFSDPYFSLVKCAAKKLEIFLKNRENKEANKENEETQPLLALFKLHEKLEEFSSFIESKRTMQKA